MAKVTKTAEDPVLGTLEYAGVWCCKLPLPGAAERGWPEELDFVFTEDGDEAGPSEASVRLARPLAERGAGLIDVILNGVWDEFTGKEPQARAWWSDDLAKANRYITRHGAAPVTTPADLPKVMRPTQAFVVLDIHGDGEPVAGLSFSADFEEEHGFDVLTDGEKVLGTGYNAEAEKYPRHSAITPEQREARHTASRQWFEGLLAKDDQA